MAIQLYGIDPTPLSDGELVLQVLRFDEHPIHRVPTYFFRMIHKETGEELGIINLRCSSIPHIERYAGHIGFAVHEPHRGHRYAARSVALLSAVSKQLKLKPFTSPVTQRMLHRGAALSWPVPNSSRLSMSQQIASSTKRVIR